MQDERPREWVSLLSCAACFCTLLWPCTLVVPLSGLQFPIARAFETLVRGEMLHVLNSAMQTQQLAPFRLWLSNLANHFIFLPCPVSSRMPQPHLNFLAPLLALFLALFSKRFATSDVWAEGLQQGRAVFSRRPSSFPSSLSLSLFSPLVPGPLVCDEAGSCPRSRLPASTCCSICFSFLIFASSFVLPPSVLQRYPPDFDPAKLPKAGKKKGPAKMADCSFMLPMCALPFPSVSRPAIWFLSTLISSLLCRSRLALLPCAGLSAAVRAAIRWVWRARSTARRRT